MINVFYVPLLLYAAYKDYKTYKIENFINLGILFLSVIDIRKFPFHLLGAVLFTVPFLYLGIKTDGLGGGDIKFIFANGCMIGLRKNYIAVLIGFIFVAVVGSIGNLYRKKGRQDKIALAPYLVSGYLIVLLCRL